MSTSAIINGPQDAPDYLGAESSEKRDFKTHCKHIIRAFTTKQGLIGTYDYGMLGFQKSLNRY
jgi:hypothetical protein